MTIISSKEEKIVLQKQESLAIKITMFPASYGDSFFVTLDGAKSLNILIDTGFYSTYEDFIKPKLMELKNQNKGLDLLVITHIDSDHIQGAIKLLEENGSDAEAKIIKIDHIWHNGYRHLQDILVPMEDVSNEHREKRIIRQILSQGYEVEKEVKANHQENIGASQGSSLATLIRKGGYAWNQQFSNQAVCIEISQEIYIGEDIKIIMLSPNKAKLDNLKKFWARELLKLGYRGDQLNNRYFDDAFEFISSRERVVGESDIKKDISHSQPSIDSLAQENFIEDTSPTNGSSISFVIEYGDLRFLFLGDSHPTLIENELRRIYQKDSLWFDAIKISHHGSKSNTSSDLLKLIDSDTYFISTNGKKFSHPDLTTLSRIVCRANSKLRKLVFNYPTDASNTLDNPNLQERFGYTIHIAEPNEIFSFYKDAI